MNSRVTVFVIDAVAIFLFAVLARAAHNSAQDPFTFVNILDTYWPFLLGVVLGTALVYRQEHSREIGSGAVIWFATVVVGLAFWAVRNEAMPHWSFILVASTMSAILLLGWRLVARVVGKRRSR